MSDKRPAHCVFIVHPSSFIVSLDHFDQMRNLRDHPAHAGGVRPLGDSVHLAQPERSEGLPPPAGGSEATADLFPAQFLWLIVLLRAHASPPSLSSPLRPRRALYSASLRSCL